MKITTKIIEGDTVNIFEGYDVNLEDDLEPEYDLENLEFKPNPYSERLRKQNKLTVRLDADISTYFHNSRAVNNYLRSQIKLIQNLAKA